MGRAEGGERHRGRSGWIGAIEEVRTSSALRREVRVSLLATVDLLADGDSNKSFGRAYWFEFAHPLPNVYHDGDRISPRSSTEGSELLQGRGELSRSVEASATFTPKVLEQVNWCQDL